MSSGHNLTVIEGTFLTSEAWGHYLTSVDIYEECT